jgi:hypothetical protein
MIGYGVAENSEHCLAEYAIAIPPYETTKRMEDEVYEETGVWLRSART